MIWDMERCQDIATDRSKRRYVMRKDVVILWQTEINGDPGCGVMP